MCLIAKELRQRETQSAKQADIKELAAGTVAIERISGAEGFHGDDRLSDKITQTILYESPGFFISPQFAMIAKCRYGDGATWMNSR
jgi:hypothetical protein